MILFHLTDEYHFRRIWDAGVLLPNSDGDTPPGHKAPPVLWLSQIPLTNLGRVYGAPRETRYLFKVNTDTAQHWDDWATQQRFSDVWMTRQRAGHPRRGPRFWVTEQPIPGRNWLAVRDLKLNKLL